MLFRKLELKWQYGVSELLIVVAGVLIALAADGWYQNLQDRALELQYIEALLEDLRADTAALRNSIDEAEARVGFGAVVLAAMETGEASVPPAEFARAVELSSFFSDPPYARSTVDELMSTGNLRLIGSQEVKSLVAEYYSEIDRRAQFSFLSREIQSELVLVMPELLDLEHRSAISLEVLGGPPWAPPQLVVTESEAQQILERLVARPELRPRLENMMRVQGTHHANLTAIRGLANEALGGLSRYLETGR